MSERFVVWPDEYVAELRERLAALEAENANLRAAIRFALANGAITQTARKRLVAALAAATPAAEEKSAILRSAEGLSDPRIWDSLSGGTGER